jgi:hypothetical protein
MCRVQTLPVVTVSTAGDDAPRDEAPTDEASRDDAPREGDTDAEAAETTVAASTKTTVVVSAHRRM